MFPTNSTYILNPLGYYAYEASHHGDVQRSGDNAACILCILVVFGTNWVRNWVSH
jgi:hypothetical protein